MKTVGIIAEYNPFHNGHCYQLKQAREMSGADFVIVVMSGDFTQRGTPALLDKYARCEMALRSGADLVIELPVCYATGSAEYFAKGAVSILEGLQTDALCFGSECGEIEPLCATARILSEEPEAFKQALSENLRKGMSFPAARSLAMGEKGTLLQTPNNILGIEYIKALYRLGSTMEVHTTKRIGAGYLDASLSGSFCSALAIRQHIYDKADIAALTSYMPKSALHILERELLISSPVSIEDFSSMLFYRLLSLQEEGYTAFADVTQALSDKISRFVTEYSSYSVFCGDLLKSKDLTLARISRSLLHILLSIKKEDMDIFSAAGNAQYARILGFKEASRGIFGILKNSPLPLISKLADAHTKLSPAGMRQLKQDIFAAHLYDSIAAQKTGRPIQNEYRRQIVILP